MSRFGALLSSGRPLVGLWQSMAHGYSAEICASAGFDWLLFDGEHAPNTIQTMLGQLQAVAGSGVHPVARPPSDDPAIIKAYLDIGFSTLLVPMVDSAEQAARIVAATRFPPHGTRGVASATSRASGFGLSDDYLQTAHEQTAVVVQIESQSALDQLGAIAAVDGVEALFIGPSDLAASLGHLGRPRHEAVQRAINGALQEIRAAGKAAGIFALDPEDAQTRINQGFSFLSVGTDIGILAAGARALRRQINCHTPG